MIGLVHGAQQTGKEVVRVEARGHPDVARNALGERMFALVETPAIEGEPQGLEHVHRERPLARDAELSDQRNRSAVGLHFNGLIDETGKLAR